MLQKLKSKLINDRTTQFQPQQRILFQRKFLHTLSTQELGRNPIQAFDEGTKRFPKEEFSLTAEVETVSCEMRSPKYPVNILKDYIKFPSVAAGHFYIH